MSLILASTSPTRHALLTAAGLHIQQQAPGIEEAPLRTDAAAAGRTAAETATQLGVAKALAVSRRYDAAVVIGADQILECDGVWFGKPSDLAALRCQLAALRGKPHCLWTAVATAQRGVETWHTVALAELHMRSFSDDFIDDYVRKFGPKLLQSVGGYRLEGDGIQLFEKVTGDFFAILGLPLLPLLNHLREIGAVSL